MTTTPLFPTRPSTPPSTNAGTAPNDTLQRQPETSARTRQGCAVPSADRISAASTSSRPRATLTARTGGRAAGLPQAAIPLQTLPSLDAGAAERGEGAIALPASTRVHAFAQTLAAWEAELAREKQRPTDPALAATVLNAIRNKGLGDLGQTHADAMALVTDHHVAQWRAALGLRPAEVALMRQNARAVGRLVPTSATLFNTISYGVLPWLTRMGSQQPWVNAGVAVAVAGVAQPLTTTLVQTPVIAALDTWRKKRGHAVALDGQVNAKRTPAEVAATLASVSADVESTGRRLQAAQAQVDQADGAIRDVFAQMARAYDVHGQAAADDDAQVSAQILARMAADPDPGRQAAFGARLVALGHRQLESRAAHAALADDLDAMHAAQKELSDRLRMSMGMLDRQKRSTQAQEWTRILRAASPLAGILGKGVEKALGKAPTAYPTAAAVGLAAAALMAQHFAAGHDEQVGASDVEEKLNMLYGRDYLTEAGHRALVAGTPILAEHVLPDELRKLAPGAASQMLAQVTRMVALHRSTLDEDDPASLAARQEVDRDLAALAQGRLTDVNPAGQAHRLLREVMAGGATGHPVVFAAREGWNKMTSLEMSAQLGQRLGLAWLGGVFGNVGATAMSRVIVAALGGPAVASLPAQAGAALLATLFGVSNAKLAWMPVPIKNERRARPDEVGFLSQLGSSLVAPVWAWRQSSAAAGALAAVHPADAGHRRALGSDEEMAALIDAMPGAFGPATPADEEAMPPR